MAVDVKSDTCPCSVSELFVSQWNSGSQAACFAPMKHVLEAGRMYLAWQSDVTSIRGSLEGVQGAHGIGDSQCSTARDLRGLISQECHDPMVLSDFFLGIVQTNVIRCLHLRSAGMHSRFNFLRMNGICTPRV